MPKTAKVHPKCDIAGARYITLSKGYVALVDEADFGWLTEHGWVARVRGKYVVACRIVRKSRQPVRMLYMHHAVGGAPAAGMMTDHINGDALDNRRSNLRFCNAAQSVWNRRPPRGESGFIGVRPPKHGLRSWQAYISANGRRIVRTAPTAEDAARIRDALARQLHGEFAVLNFPPEAV